MIVIFFYQEGVLFYLNFGGSTRLVQLVNLIGTDNSILIIFSGSTRKYKELIFVSGQRGTPKLIVDGYSFIRNKGNFKTTYWRCSKLRTLGCKAKVVTNKDDNKVSITTPGHCHMPDYEQYT